MVERAVRTSFLSLYLISSVRDARRDDEHPSVYVNPRARSDAAEPRRNRRSLGLQQSDLPIV